jgi:signal transduction histidine kinase
MTASSWLARPYDLRHAFLLGVLLPLAGLSASVVLLMVNWAERSLESRLQGEIELISRAVTPGISTNLERGNDDEIRRSLESLFSIRRVYGAAVYDDAGELVVSAGIADREVRTSDTATDVVRTGQDTGTYRSVEGENVYSYFSPLLDYGGRIQGLLQITRDRQEIDAAIADVRTLGWSLWTIGIIASAVAALVLYRRLVGQHVLELRNRMQAMSSGKRDVRFEATSPKEFAEIGGAFNAMVDSVRQAEEEVERRQQRERTLERQLQESERIAVVGRVVQGLAHELGSPLSVIDGRVRRLERDIATRDPDGNRFLQDIRRQVSRMTDIVRQLLNYGRTDTSARTRISVTALLNTVCREHDEARIAVCPGSPDAIVYGDPVRLELAVSNLVRNAVRHAHRQVTIGVEDAGDGLLALFVEDDGPGVAAEDLPQIFEPFFTRQPPGQGTGLGLAIVASVMREHDGDVQVEPAPTGGARFTLRLPVETA